MGSGAEPRPPATFFTYTEKISANFSKFSNLHLNHCDRLPRHSLENSRTFQEALEPWQGVALTGRKPTGPPCSRGAIIRLEAAWCHHLDAACRPAVQCYRRRRQTTDARDHLLVWPPILCAGGPVISMSVILIVWPECTLRGSVACCSHGESRWMCRRDRQSDRRFVLSTKLKQMKHVQFVSTLSKESFDLQHSAMLLWHCCFFGWGLTCLSKG